MCSKTLVRFARRYVHWPLALIATTLALLAQTSARAVDGVIEINQSSALAGVGLGDAPGFPVTLALRGSYRLTGELNVPANVDAIVIQNDHVSIDLNGFSIVGGGGVAGYGISVASSTVRASRVENGTIRSMGRTGLSLGDEAHVEDMVVIGSGYEGIRVLENGLIEGCTAVENGGTGYFGNKGTRIHRSTAARNGGYGFYIWDGVLAHVIANENAWDGVFAPGASVVQDSISRANGGHGISAIQGLVARNTIISNDGHGLKLSDSVAHRDNALSQNNSSGQQIDGGTALGSDLCGAALCP